MPEFISEYGGVKVWRALEILVNAIERGVLQVDCSNPTMFFEEYMNDTLHVFPRRDYSIVVEWVGRLCREGKKRR